MAKNSDVGESAGVKDFFTTDRNDLYSYTECRAIGKNFLKELKQAVIGKNLQEIEEPHAKATKYLEETEILHLLEDLITKLVFKRPEKPMEFLVKEIEEFKRRGSERQSMD
ncbi:uncharacterized protein LOC111339040 [Stylophora pistillata]|uniref:Uncharacterized protein n=1 Tax=Stylophora pistillata TaxID=50429 RepID=A0A2B4RK62_STYPI|nr:uncharacterized protein LOC111339040 [Stylophora pistillata]PFX18784.1 hypothetical protein AWC38_SpisGene16819 [Stylophora pistillata]